MLGAAMEDTQQKVKKPSAIFGILSIAAPFVVVFATPIHGGLTDLIGFFRRALIIGFVLALISIWRNERWRVLLWLVAISYVIVWFCTIRLVTPIF
jgi:hypothetical protein